MAIDWTKVPVGNLFGWSGDIPEYRVENDGRVRWRGEVVQTADGVGLGGIGLQVYIPVEARPVRPAVYYGWDGIPTSKNITITAAFYMLVGYFTSAAQQMPIDLVDIQYQGTPPPSATDHSLESVQAGLADALRTIAKLRVYDFPSDRIEPPAAVLSLPESPYDVTLSGRSDEWTFPLWVLIAKADDKASYKEMVPYLEAEGSKSIRAAIEADRTLGGACDSTAVIRARPMFATIAGTEFLAVEFTLEVYT